MTVCEIADRSLQSTLIKSEVNEDYHITFSSAIKPKSGSKHLRLKDEHLNYTSWQYLEVISIYPIVPLGDHQQADNYTNHSAF